MKLQRTLVLLLTLVAFGAFLYYYEIHKENVQQELERKNALIIRSSVDKIQKISFSNSYDEFEMLNADGLWVLTKPVSDYADKFVIHRLLEFFAKQMVFQDLSSEENAEEKFKFSDLNPWIQVVDRNGNVFKVWISDLVGMQGATYLKLKVSGIEEKTHYYLAAPEWRGEFDRTLLYFRDKFIFKQDMNALQAIEKWSHGKKIYEVKNFGDEDWRWMSEVPIDKTKVYDLIQDLVQVAATDFLETESLTGEKKKQIGFDKILPEFHLTLKNNEGFKKIIFSYAKPNPQKVYINTGNKVYEIFANALGFLDWNIDDYKNRSKPFEVEVTEVDEIQLLRRGSSLSFKKQGGAWEKDFQGNRFLRVLSEQKVVRYLPERLPPAHDTSLVLVSNNKEVLRLSWAMGTTQKQILMTSSKINETFLVEGEEWQKMIAFITGDVVWEKTSSVSK